MAKRMVTIGLDAATHKKILSLVHDERTVFESVSHTLRELIKTGLEKWETGK